MQCDTAETVKTKWSSTIQRKFKICIRIKNYYGYQFSKYLYMYNLTYIKFSA